MAPLAGKIALVTGGTSGIGLATARRFVDAGAQVLVTGSSESSVAQARAALGERAQVLQSNAADAADVAALFEQVRSRHGRLDVLFLNAGIAKFAPVEQLPESAFDALMAINLKGPWLALRAASPLLAEGASVIVTTTIAAGKGYPGSAAYAASKAALRALARVVAAEWAPRGIRVNAICPGPIDTPIYDKLGMPAEMATAFRAGMQQNVPMKRWGRAEEIAEAALFLASASSSFSTGIEITADGGSAQF